MHRHSIVVAIDASRNRSGGAKAHLLGVLQALDPREYGVRKVHVWAYSSLLSQIPDYQWLVKHSPDELDQSLFHQLWWQYIRLPSDIRRAGCNILLSTDAGTVCPFSPNVVMSRDMLSFEPHEMNRYPLFSPSRLRLLILKFIQVRSLKYSSGALFLTRYASDVIRKHTGKLKSYTIIPHGIGDNFRQDRSLSNWPSKNEPIRCIYVSNADLYKHQWHVIKAVDDLRSAGYNIRLTLVGAAEGPAADKVAKQLVHSDPLGNFISLLPNQPHSEVANLLHHSHVAIFASSCENMPNTLVEAMAAGLPIACSNRGPMPEILMDGGVYFDPEDPISISESLKLIFNQGLLRDSISDIALNRSRLFSWERCARETWQYLAAICSCHLNSLGYFKAS